MHRTYYYDLTSKEKVAHEPVELKVNQFRREKAPSRVKISSKNNDGKICLALITVLLLGAAGLVALFGNQIQNTWYVMGGEEKFSTTLPDQFSGYEIFGQATGGKLKQASLGGDFRLTLTDVATEDLKTLQTIYQEVNPAVVGIQGGNRTSMGVGTGVILSEDGYIVTNHHVIEDLNWVDVILENGDVYQASLVGSDSDTDLAVLKIHATELPTATFGHSDDTLVGETVVAIGNPTGMDLRGTMTDGIVSAINRDVTVDQVVMNLIQTTAALNSGNSGGALVNQYGQVIGITNLKLMAPEGEYNVLEGLGFAIPSATVKTVVDSIIVHGYVVGRPTLGIVVQPMTMQEKVATNQEQGLWVRSTQSGAQASEVLMENDLLLSANGVELHTNNDLLELKNAMMAGEVITFVVWREEEELTVDVTVMEQQDIK